MSPGQREQTIVSMFMNMRFHPGFPGLHAALHQLKRISNTSPQLLCVEHALAVTHKI